TAVCCLASRSSKEARRGTFVPPRRLPCPAFSPIPSKNVTRRPQGRICSEETSPVAGRSTGFRLKRNMFRLPVQRQFHDRTTNSRSRTARLIGDIHVRSHPNQETPGGPGRHGVNTERLGGRFRPRQ